MINSELVERRLDSLEDTSKDCIFAIYGASEFGKITLNSLKEQGFTNFFFVDSYEEGEFQGHDKVLPEKLLSSNKADLIVIASCYYVEIIETLKSLNIDNWKIAKYPWDRHTYFTENEAIEYDQDFKQISNLLFDEHSIQLFDLLLQGRLTGLPIDQHNKLISPLQTQYLDHIVFHNILVAIEAGVYDGTNSLDFLRRLPEASTIHAFEPSTTVEIYAEVLNNPRFILNQKALWNKSTTLNFYPSGSSAVCYDQENDDDDDLKVPAITIDEYVEEMGLEHLDFIKMDIEGGEPYALEGGEKSIAKFRPQMAISIYHNISDFRMIPLSIGKLPKYRHFLKHYSGGLSETVWYAIPEEKLV